MRVTGMMQNIQLLKNLRNINSSLTTGQQQLATGQKISKPSDDPIGTGYQMRYDTDLARSEEFLMNAETGTEILKTMDSLFQQASDVLKRARTLALQGANGTVDDKQRQTIASEIKQLKEQMVTIGNSTFNGRYLFNGQKTDLAPYTVDGAAEQITDPGLFYLNVSPAVKVPVSITGEVVFGEANSDENVFKVLDDLAEALEDNSVDGIQESVNLIDVAVDRLNVSWAEAGARMNRFDLMINRIQDDQVSLKEQRSNVADVDFAEAITDLKMKENVLQAALSTGARIMQISLVDFLR
ncbi:MAG: flagellar hook-associated protein FlgL [Paenibacillus sp.]|uniref:Flagellar hook-associated protein FlgL n=1 Tax=Paenibacillus timonensis TaxID=225915 RepID=A0ABW3S9N1_9BACL|nr:MULTISPECIES: flagellar hook-associated protein FlgL [Paenibacillus]MCH1640512.1 flagellar hook-associated protein FlgL [Paenibacillus timonensis]MDU2242274.1 flagellar hook-associated protein FlgL [Paenibacillus sp.]MDU4695605.1 flagellar hook-associated protein FlgL [Paenibacillus sp.]